MAQASAAGHRSATPVAGTLQPLVLFAQPPKPDDTPLKPPPDPSPRDPSTSHPGLAAVLLVCRFGVESS